MSAAGVLVTHMAKFYSDGILAHDFDAVIAAASSGVDRDIVTAYRQLRRTAPGWAPGSYRANNHGAIDPIMLAALTTPRHCRGCGKSFAPKSLTSRYCAEC